MKFRMFTERFASELRELGLHTLEGVKSASGTPVKDHKGQRDISTFVIGSNSRLYLKRYWKSYKKDALAALLRHGEVRSPARREWENLKRLEISGFQVAPLVACGEECGLFWDRFSFIITESAPGISLPHWLKNTADGESRKMLLLELSQWIRRFHEAGFSSPDLMAKHLFVHTKADEFAGYSFSLFDIARLDSGKPTFTRRVRDLAVLNLSIARNLLAKEERDFFLAEYAKGQNPSFFSLLETRMARLLKRRKYGKLWNADS